MNGKNFKCILILCLVTVCANAQTLEYVEHKVELASEVLGESRTATLFLPKEIKKPLPVMYVLDGEWNHDFVKGTVGLFRRWNRIPDMAIVSVDNINRTRDFTPTEDDARFPGSGEADKFLQFLKDELIPFLEAKYMMSDERILFGHSFGGLFALYTLKKSPALFDAYISVSPSVWWKDNFMYGDYSDAFDSGKPFVYATAGTHDRGNTAALQTYIEFLTTSGLADKIELHWDIHEGENHYTNVSATLHEGLKKLFPVNPFESQVIKAWEDEGEEGVSKWYRDTQKAYGFRFRLPKDAIRIYAYSLHSEQGKSREAMEFMSWLATISGDDYQVFYFLGVIAQEAGLKEKAMSNFEKALELGKMPLRVKTVIERSLKEIKEQGS